jgi:hypothetical protein
MPMATNGTAAALKLPVQSRRKPPAAVHPCRLAHRVTAVVAAALTLATFRATTRLPWAAPARAPTA